MNKWLLIWNIVLTLALIPAVLGGCSQADSRVDWLVQQVQSQAAAIGKLQGDVNQNNQTIQNQAVQLAAVNTYVQSSINQLQQYIQAVLATR
ncbi:MAG: hypothetical protein PHR56_07760 [Dehalococcoidales bacterium]|nr:hypothetical protein [Dehalococcoidales bacterium]